MRYEVRLDTLEPVYHARTAAQLMLQELNVDDQVTRKSLAAVKAAFQSLPVTSEVTELRNLMASIATTEPSVINQTSETRQSVVNRLVSIMEEVRTILE